MNRLPSFIIIGAMKAATTSLHHYLDKHPEISMSLQKEPDFFLDAHWHKGVSYYESCFADNSLMKGEASPNYSKHPAFPNVPKRMHSVVPHAKLIYILRDPIERMVSQYHHELVKGRETASIETIAESPSTNHHVQVSKYHYQLSQFLAYYPKEHILITTAERLKKHQQAVLQEIYTFLGVDPSFAPESPMEAKHQSIDKRKQDVALVNMINRFGFTRKLKEWVRGIMPKNLYRSMVHSVKPAIPKPIISEKLRSILLEEFRSDVEKLQEFSGQRFEEWKNKFTLE